MRTAKLYSLHPIAAILAISLASVITSQTASASSREIRYAPIDIDSTETTDSLIAESPQRVYPRMNEQLQMELGGSYYTLTNGYAPWSSVYLQAAYPFGDRKTVYGQIEYLNEYSLGDGDAFVGLYYPLLKDLTAVVEGEVGFTHHITPVWSLFGQLNYKLFPGFLIEGGFRNSDYQDAAGLSNQVQLFNVTAEYWFSYFRAMYTFYESRGNGGVWNPPSHLAEFGYYYGDANSITLGAGMGHEVDRIAFAGGAPFLDVYDTKTVFLLGRHWFSWAWGMSYELGWHQMNQAFTSSTLYDRYGIRLGIRHRF